jgi:hypothetical protein
VHRIRRSAACGGEQTRFLYAQQDFSNRSENVKNENFDFLLLAIGLGGIFVVSSV